MRMRPDIGCQRPGGDITRRDGHDDGRLVIDPHAHVAIHDTLTPGRLQRADHGRDSRRLDKQSA